MCGRHIRQVALCLALSFLSASASLLSTGPATGQTHDEEGNVLDWVLDHYDPNPHDTAGLEYPYIPESRPEAEYDPPWPWKSDRVLKADVQNHLQVNPFVNVEDIDVSVKDGVVTLKGGVHDREEISDAIATAYEAGAKNVVSRLEARKANE
jgi:hypothetical protein